MEYVSEGERARLYHGVAEHVGANEAETLMQLLPTSQWEDLATKADLAVLRADTQVGFAQVDVKIEQTRWLLV